ncbi:hypothetical protein [Desulfovibrio sp. ZJ200]|uniref:hypothetical protein n=1 Tax=Desulfovibrio sp. ZJ200 TaxID=2709792 RepID=UPI0013EA15F5|nr:hypothetical protein [Desulfovibrio sp. ZJ200]
MMDAKLADLISALPESAALAGIRAYIIREGLEGNLEDAAKAFEQVLQCEGQEGIKAELAEFLVARYAYRGNLETARKLYARFASLSTSGATLQAQVAALHILACMVMDVKLDDAIRLWRDYVQLPIPAQFKKLSAHTGLAALRQARKNSDSRRARVVFSTLRALAQETGDEKIAIRAKEVFEKGASR